MPIGRTGGDGRGGLGLGGGDYGDYVRRLENVRYSM